jgi:hypothetical protein
MAYFKALSQHLPEGPEENLSQDIWILDWKFEPRTSLIQSSTLNHLKTTNTEVPGSIPGHSLGFF